jgi:hypothetical protein
MRHIQSLCNLGQSHRQGTGLPSRHPVASSRNTDSAFFVLAFWVAEFGGQDRLAPAK